MDDGTGIHTFFPPDPIQILSNRSALLTIVSHHFHYLTGNETEVVHELRVEIPEDSPMILTDAFDSQNDANQFQIFFRVTNSAPGTPAGAAVFTLAHTADAAPVNYSTPAPQWNDAIRLSAHPSVTDGQTRFEFSRTMTSPTVIEIHDVRGRRVRSLSVDSEISTRSWDGRDDRGRKLASGVYFAQVRGVGGKPARVILVR